MQEIKYYFFLLLLSFNGYAQEFETRQNKTFLGGFDYQLKAGIGMGGAAPLPMPREIRKIKSYKPTYDFLTEANVTKWITKSWGVRVGVKLDNKGMKTDARTKDYGMEIKGDKGELLAGRWTGNVKTKMNNAYLTFPVLITYRITDSWNIMLGEYFSYLISKDFSGYVYDGYLRRDEPTGDFFPFSGEDKPTYDFSSDLRKFQWGLQLSSEYKLASHLNIFFDLTWGMNDIFKPSFKTITFDMYPIYLYAGFGYIF